MFSLNENNHYYFHTQATDLRKGFNTLMGVITSTSSLRPLDGSVYLFVNKQRSTLKLLHWERGGFVIYHKRLEIPADIERQTRVIEPAVESFIPKSYAGNTLLTQLIISK